MCENRTCSFALWKTGGILKDAEKPLTSGDVKELLEKGASKRLACAPPRPIRNTMPRCILTIMLTASPSSAPPSTDKKGAHTIMKRLITLILTLIMLYAIALADEPATTMIGAANVPSIPAGTLSASLVSFTSNQTYPVYSAPDSKSVRGAKDRARVSTNGWIQVFGSESDWILVQYDITDTHNRIGYIYKNALPADVTVPELNLTSIPSVVHYDVEVTDDPLVSRTPLARLTENSKVNLPGHHGRMDVH